MVAKRTDCGRSDGPRHVTLQQLGVRGCAARVAGEFGDHPDTAVARMSWALATINTAFPAPSIPPTPGPRSLAFAS